MQVMENLNKGPMFLEAFLLHAIESLNTVAKCAFGLLSSTAAVADCDCASNSEAKRDGLTGTVRPL